VESVDWVHLVQDRGHLQDPVNTVMSIQEFFD
jgi:hypothetical protein